MTYGNKIIFFLFIFLLFFVVGCSNQENFYYELYDGYQIQKIDDTIKLYKDSKLVSINDLDYKIEKFKYNSDVVCLKLNDNNYYMIYYVDSSIYGPYDLDSLNTTANSLSMTFDKDFIEVMKADGLIYEK
ncbi:MAG: hypothetical protein IJ501_05845 [Bacilli bacterium]|nr:hypothetical protein [Bacilli bacterium]